MSDGLISRTRCVASLDSWAHGAANTPDAQTTARKTEERNLEEIFIGAVGHRGDFADQGGEEGE